MCLFILFEHFIDGRTLFKYVNFSKPSTKVVLRNGICKLSNYWLPENLCIREKCNLELTEYALYWRELIKKYLEYLTPSDITMTLTG